MGLARPYHATDKLPSSGEVGLCGICGEVVAIAPDGSLQVATEEQFMKYPTADRIDMGKLQQMIRGRKK
jgi:hypothetical protein